MADFVFDPRVFILPPFRACPNCHRQETYGVLMIGGQQYTRRCRECWHSETYPLPAINKKVIYLDQMVVSNMTKALHPTAAAGRAIDPFWRELFEKLDVVCKRQLAICPDSATHREESAVWRIRRRSAGCTSISRTAFPSTTRRRCARHN